MCFTRVSEMRLEKASRKTKNAILSLGVALTLTISFRSLQQTHLRAYIKIINYIGNIVT